MLWKICWFRCFWRASIPAWAWMSWFQGLGLISLRLLTTWLGPAPPKTWLKWWSNWHQRKSMSFSRKLWRLTFRTSLVKTSQQTRLMRQSNKSQKSKQTKASQQVMRLTKSLSSSQTWQNPSFNQPTLFLKRQIHKAWHRCWCHSLRQTTMISSTQLNNLKWQSLKMMICEARLETWFLVCRRICSLSIS